MRATRIWLFAIMVVGVALRLPGIGGRALWIDEAFCVRLAQLDWGQLVSRSALDNHPPLFFALLKVWMAAFGSSPFALRSLDVLLAAGTLWLVHALALRIVRAVAPEVAGLAASLAAAWIALDPVHVLWSAQVRMYALAGLLAAGSGLALWRALERPAVWSRWAAWSAVAIALVYTHYFGAFVVLAQGVLAGITALRSPAAERRTNLVRVAVSGVAICAALAPWLGVVLAQSARVASGWWVPPLTPARLLWAWSRTAGLLVEDEFTIPSGVGAVVIGALALAVAALVVRAAVHRDRGLRLAAWCTLAPLIAGLAVTLVLRENVVLARYLIVGQVFLPIAVVGVVFARAPRRSGALWLTPVALLVAITLAAQVRVLIPKADLPAASAWIEARRQPGDLVVVHQFYYWWFRIRTAERAPDLRLFSHVGRPIQELGSALITDDIVLGSAELARQRGRIFVVDNDVLPAAIPATFRKLASERFAAWMPPGAPFAIRVTLYDAPE